MSRQEIIPPGTNIPSIPEPRRGIVEYVAKRWENNRTAGEIHSIARIRDAQRGLLEFERGVINTLTLYKRDIEELVRLDDTFEHERAVIASKRAEKLRKLRHEHELNQERRRTAFLKEELKQTNLHIEIAKSRTALESALQKQLAQKKHGQLDYAPLTKQEQLEREQLELALEERRAPKEPPTTDEATREIYKALLNRRDLLESAGQDTDAITELIERYTP